MEGGYYGEHVNVKHFLRGEREIFQRADTGKRLKELRDDLRLKLREVAQATGMSTGSISDAEHGRVRPPEPLLAFMAAKGVNLHYVLTGRPPKYRAECLPPTAPEDYSPVPLVADLAAAGPARFVSDQVLEMLLVPRRWLKSGGDYAAIRIKGISMAPTLAEGDIVGVNRENRDARQLRGKIAAAFIEDEGVTIKRLQISDHEEWLIAENLAAWTPTLIRPGRDWIIGAVEWAWRRFE